MTRLKNEIADRVRRSRIDSGLTQVELGERMGLTRCQITDIEAGVRSIRAEELPPLVAALDVGVEWLVG